MKIRKGAEKMSCVPTYLKMTLESLRVRMNMTQEQAASALGITKETLRRWEKEPSKVPIGHMQKLADLYYIPIDHIFFDSHIAFSDKIKQKKGHQVL